MDRTIRISSFIFCRQSTSNSSPAIITPTGFSLITFHLVHDIRRVYLTSRHSPPFLSPCQLFPSTVFVTCIPVKLRCQAPSFVTTFLSFFYSVVLIIKSTNRSRVLSFFSFFFFHAEWFKRVRSLILKMETIGRLYYHLLRMIRGDGFTLKLR